MGEGFAKMVSCLILANSQTLRSHSPPGRMLMTITVPATGQGERTGGGFVVKGLGAGTVEPDWLGFKSYLCPFLPGHL